MIDSLKAAPKGSQEKFLEDSGWLEGKSMDEIAKTLKGFLLRLLAHVDEAKKVLGDPDTDTEVVAEWYPDVVASHGWTLDDGVVALSVVQRDKDSQIAITLRYFPGAVAQDSSE